MIEKRNTAIERFLFPETIYQAECAWCGLTEEYDSLSGCEADGWSVGCDDEGIGLWCGKCNDE
jgi:hypothetical protein